MRRIAAGAVVLAALINVYSGAAGAEYPDHPIRILVEFPAGGAADVVARRMGAKLGDRLGQQVLIDNRSGAGGVIAHEYVAKSAPDGYTLLLATTSVTANPSLRKKLPYDPQTDFVPIALLADWGGLFALHPSVPGKTLGEFVKFVKANPDKLSYSSAGTGTWPHLSMEMFTHRAGIRMVHIPYKGAVPALQDVIAGFVAAKIDSYITTVPHMKTGRLKVLAVTTGSRMSQLPEIPTIAEQGYPGYDTAIWLGLVAPKGTPRDIVAKLEQNVIAIIKDKDMTSRLIEDGYRPRAASGAELGAFIRSEVAQWQQVVREVGISPTD
jgi:tripartite-type tricarboxylate transporter receptor subunit TctC